MAVNLSGTSQFYHTATSPVTAVPFTLALWFNLGVDGSFTMMGLGGTADDANDWRLSTVVTSLVLRVAWQDSVGSSVVSSTATCAVGTWSHAAMTMISTQLGNVYVDGVELVGASQTARTPASVDRIGVGCRPLLTPSTIEWNGDIFWPAVWDVQLTAAEVGHLANGANPRTIRRKNLVFFQPLANTKDIVDVVSNRAITTSGAPTDVADPDGVKRVLPRGRGRSSLRLSA